MAYSFRGFQLVGNKGTVNITRLAEPVDASVPLTEIFAHLRCVGSTDGRHLNEHCWADQDDICGYCRQMIQRAPLTGEWLPHEYVIYEEPV